MPGRVRCCSTARQLQMSVAAVAVQAAVQQGVTRCVSGAMGVSTSDGRGPVPSGAPGRRTTSVFSALLLAVSGVAFAGSVQVGFERIWGIPAGPWHKIWRQAVWLAALTAYIYAEATVGFRAVAAGWPARRLWPARPRRSFRVSPSPPGVLGGSRRRL